MSARVDAYPWSRLPRLSRAGLRSARGLRRAALAGFDPERLAPALGELLRTEVRLHAGRLDAADAPDVDDLWLIQLVLVPADVTLHVLLDPELVRIGLGLALDRQPALGLPPAGADPALRGAAAALIAECARRSARGAGSFVVARSVRPVGPGAQSRGYVELLGRRYTIILHVSGEPAPAFAPSDAELFERLGRLTISLPVAGGLALADPGTLARLAPGDVWLPGGRAWIERLALAGPLAGSGSAVELTSEGKLVLRGQRVELGQDAEELGEPMASENQPENATREAVLDAPLVVRIELGTVSLSGREWAALQPGDVLETRQAIGQSVTLRIAGREVARGELVDVEGELGVRIQHLIGEDAQ